MQDIKWELRDKHVLPLLLRKKNKGLEGFNSAIKICLWSGLNMRKIINLTTYMQFYLNIIVNKDFIVLTNLILLFDYFMFCNIYV